MYPFFLLIKSFLIFFYCKKEKKDTPSLISSYKCPFGPSNLMLYVYNFKSQIYKAIVDTDKIRDFKKFTEFLLTYLLNKPSIPNKLKLCDRCDFDIVKFNHFLGPNSDFYKNLPGIYSPYTFSFFCFRDKVSVFDMNRRRFTIKKHDNIEHFIKHLWKNDCLKRD